MALEFAARQQ